MDRGHQGRVVNATTLDWPTVKELLSVVNACTLGEQKVRLMKVLEAANEQHATRAKIDDNPVSE